jgi:hypothetical protein
MATVRIYDCTNGVLALDLRDLLGLLGSRSLQAIWTASPVKMYYPELDVFEEHFMVSEPSGDQLDVLARNRSSVSGTVLTELANAVWQVIWGEFIAVLPGQDATWVTVRAIDSTFYEVTTTDDSVLNQVKSTYKDVRIAPGPVTSTPIPQVPHSEGTDRSTALMALSEGDIFHATTPNGASFICLVTSVANGQICARRVTTQEQLAFDRATGIAEIGDDSVACTIDSIAPSPAKVREVLLQLDQRYGAGDDPRLREEEIDALLFLGRLYRAHSL